MRKAVTVIFEFEGKILTIERQPNLSVFPGYTAFPGGKVDKSDKSLEDALKREVKEELGICLDDLKASNILEEIKLFGKATTPKFNPYRFETFFYLISLTRIPEMIFEVGEVKSHSWKFPRELIKDYQDNNILCVPPTIQCFHKVDSFLEDGLEVSLDLEYDDDSEIPMIESLYHVKQFLPLSNTFPPANRTNSFLINDILIDPSPKNEEEYQKFVNTLQSFKVNQIFITHHHPDHHEFATKLANELNVSIRISSDSYQRIKEKYGNDYFQDVEINIAKDGDTLTTLSDGRQVLLMAVPGHDEGQLAIYDENLKWNIVGDLIQTVGTVVIGDKEGDMKKYFSSLENVIKQSPKFIIPSHGIAMGGTNKLEMTLKHRKMREKTIIQLLNENKSVEDIFEHIYEGLDERLKKYALKTIHAHIKKIEQDQQKA
ncbi:MAG: MBL fold metallo-hydrolase [Oligoflexia bacterium]|nr:MBL fold metallo-hydrolase [Oligoflexia bacterium]